MPKTVFVPGSVVDSDTMNALNNPVFVQGTPDNDGEIPAIVDNDLSDSEGIKPTFYTYYDALRVTQGASGLQLAFNAGSVLLEDRTGATISGGVINAIDDSTSFVFVDTTGTVSVAATLPDRCLPMARIVSSGGGISSIEDLRPRWQVGPIPSKILLDDGILVAAINQGRLTLQTGNPTPATESVDASTLYFTPYTGNTISLYNTTLQRWELYQFTERSLALAGGAANTVYDIFIYDDNGTLTLEREAWTGLKTRAVSLTTQNGIQVKGGGLNKRYIGTIYQDTNSTTQDTNDKVFIWNAQNRVTKNMIKQMLGIDTYTYGIEAWRKVFNVNDFRFQIVTGASTPLQIQSGLIKTKNFISPATGIGVDSETDNSAQIYSNPGGGSREMMLAFYQGQNFGFSYYQMLEWGNEEDLGSGTPEPVEFNGDYQANPNNPTRENNGISGIIGIHEY